MISTEYRGHNIVFNENSDEWSCYDLGCFSHHSLSKVKAKIDKLYRDARKKASVECLEISSHSGFSITDSRVVEYIKPKRDWKGDADAIVDHVVACIAMRDGDCMSRREIEMSRLAADTKLSRVACRDATIAWEAVVDAQRKYRAAVDRIPRISLDDIAGLIRLKNDGLEEDA